MAFKIIQKIKPDQIQDKSLDMGFLKKYYRQLQKMLVMKTDPQNPTGYFFCADYSDGEDLLIMGNQTPAYLKVFRAAGKGKDGFDKKNVSIGNCFILIEGNKKILCLLPNSSLAKGKKMTVLKAMKKLRKAAMKQVSEIRWLKGPIDAETGEEAEATADVNEQQDSKDAASETAGAAASATSGNSGGAQQQVPQVSKEEIVKKTKELQKGIKKLKDDIIPRFKKKETGERDAKFVKALRKAGNLFLGKLMMADPALASKFSTQKEQLQKGIPQWEDLEKRILGQQGGGSGTEELKQNLRATVKRMNETRAKIKELLQKVNFKALQ